MKNWQYRREVMQWDVAPEGRFVMVMLIDLFDWNTNEKYFKSWDNCQKWMQDTADKYRVTFASISRAMMLMQDAGLLVETKAGAEGIVLSLTTPDPERVKAVEANLQAKREKLRQEVLDEIESER